jgi:hypothetical protein
LIDEAAKRLSKLNEKDAERPFIHLTFLDAYTPKKEDREGPSSYGSLPGYPNHYSEHYVDSTLSPIPDLLYKTNAILPKAFNFDITNWDGADKGNPLFVGIWAPIYWHWWPVNWYIHSITAPEFNDGFPGFPLSFEGGYNQFNGLDQQYRPGEQCPLKNTAKEYSRHMCAKMMVCLALCHPLPYRYQGRLAE